MTVDELQPDPHEGLEAQIAQWRRYVRRREAISALTSTNGRSPTRTIDELSAPAWTTRSRSWSRQAHGQPGRGLAVRPGTIDRL